MFNNRTVVVVGAGASKEANLPTGVELRGEIARLLNIYFDHRELRSGDARIVDALRMHVRKPDRSSGDINPYRNAALMIANAMPYAISIDNFLDAHPTNEHVKLCGKLAIVRSILEAERRSALFLGEITRSSELRFDESIAGTWFIRFLQLLTENCRVDQLAERLKLLTLIIFNYDRCIEHFLHVGLRTYYGISSEHAAELVKAIEIYHPYGTVGLLPWQLTDGGVPFGAEPEAYQLLVVASQIKTFAEGTDPQHSDIVAIRRRMREAQILVFLGFAFHKLNLQLLAAEGPKLDASLFATARGISTKDCELVEAELKALKPVTRCELRQDLTCAGLFDEYWRSLALS